MNILAKVHADNTKFATTTVRDTPGHAAFFEFWKIHEIVEEKLPNQNFCSLFPNNLSHFGTNQ